MLTEVNNGNNRDQILSLKTKEEAVISVIIYFRNVNLPHDKRAYPPKIYFPILTIVTVGPLRSHLE